MIRVAVTPAGLVFRVRAKPGASRRRALGEHNGALRVETTAPPEKGKANRDIVEIVAAALGLRKSQVAIAAGEKERDKEVLVTGMAAADLEARLNSLAR